MLGRWKGWGYTLLAPLPLAASAVATLSWRSASGVSASISPPACLSHLGSASFLLVLRARGDTRRGKHSLAGLSKVGLFGLRSKWINPPRIPQARVLLLSLCDNCLCDSISKHNGTLMSRALERCVDPKVLHHHLDDLGSMRFKTERHDRELSQGGVHFPTSTLQQRRQEQQESVPSGKSRVRWRKKLRFGNMA